MVLRTAGCPLQVNSQLTVLHFLLGCPESHLQAWKIGHAPGGLTMGF